MKRILKGVDRVLGTVSSALMAALILVVLYSVFSRYILNASIAWAEELSRFLLIGVVCMGAVTAYFRNEHLGLDILVKMLPEAAHKYVDIIRNLLLLLITAFMAWGGFRMMMESMDSLSPALRVRVGYIYTILPLFSGLLCLTTAVRLAEVSGRLWREKEGKEW